MSNPSPSPGTASQQPFSPASLPSPTLYQAITHAAHPAKASTGGTYDLPSPGLRAATLSEPLAFPLTEVQAWELIEPTRFSRSTHGVRVDLNASKSGCWQVKAEFLAFHNPAWKTAVNKLVHHAAKELGLDSSYVSASLYCMMIYSQGETFKPTSSNNGSRQGNVFGTLCLQLPSSFQGGEHTIIHQGNRKVYHRGGKDGSSVFNYYYTAFFDDVKHDVNPITHGFRIALLYKLHWSGGSDIPRSDISRINYLADSLLKHSRQFSLGAWTLVYGLKCKYAKYRVQKQGVKALKDTDLQEYTYLQKAAIKAGLGPIGALVCSMTRTNICKDDKACQIKEECAHGSPQLDGIIGDADGLIRSHLQCFDWGSLNAQLAGTGRYCQEDRRGKGTQVFAVVLWSKQKEPELRCLCALNVNRFIDPSSRGPHIASTDPFLIRKEWYAHNDISKSLEATSLFEIALRSKSLPEANRALNIALQGARSQCVETMICEAISAFGWEKVRSFVEKYVCAEMGAGRPCLVGRIRMLSELLSRDFSFSAAVRKALDLIAEDIQSATALHFRPIPREVIPRRRPSDVILSENANRKSLVSIWSKLLGAIGAVYAICSSDTDTSYVKKICHRLADIVKQRDDSDLSIIVEAIEISADTEQSENFVQSLKDAIVSRRTELLISRFLNETDRLVSLVGKSHPSLSSFDWTAFLRLTAKVMSREAENKAVSTKFSEFLNIASDVSFVSKHDSLLSATIELEEDTDSEVLSKIKQAALGAKLRRKEQGLRGIMHSLENLTRNAPFQVTVSFPGDYETGVPEIEEFMASDRMQISVRLADMTKANEIFHKLRRKLPPGTKARCGSDGNSAYIVLQKPFEKARARRLRYEKNVKELDRIRKKHEAIVARLKRSEFASEQGVSSTCKFARLKKTENASEEIKEHAAPFARLRRPDIASEHRPAKRMKAVVSNG